MKYDCCVGIRRGSAFTLSLAAIVLVAALPLLNAEDKPSAAAPQAVEEDMHEFMEYVFEPGYKRLKAALAAKPADKEAWKPIKGDALTLAEACNLLFDRAPEEHADIWNSSTAGSRTSAAALYQAAKAGDLAAAESAWRETLTNCNKCHQKFAEDHILPIDGE